MSNAVPTLTRERTRLPHVPIRQCMVVVEDDPAIVTLFRALARQLDCELQSYGSVAEFRARPQPDRPGCFVFDLNLPDGTGLDLLRHLVADGNTMPVVFMSGMGKVAEAVQALKLGSIDFIEKPFDVPSMQELLRRALALDLERRCRDDHLIELARRFATLSPREVQVMERIVQGAANRQVADDLGVSPKTVEVHRANVMRKTGAQSLAELVRMHVDLCERDNSRRP